MADWRTDTERAQLALMVIGPDRRERLISSYADRLSLTHGMTAAAARRYATELVDDADSGAILRIGQTWTQRDGDSLPGAEISSSLQEKSYTVVGFTDDGLVSVGDGNLHLGAHLFARMWLTAWPPEHTLIEEPQAPQAALAPPEEEVTGGDDEERFDPHQLWVMAHRASTDGLPRGEGLPLLGEDYQAVNWRKPEYEPSYGNVLDIPAYLGKYLTDYRAGWPDFRAQFQHQRGANVLTYFNTLGGCECDIAVAAYLGHWLWQRARSDVVTQYGGTVDDYDVMFMWGPFMADAVLEVALYAHPDWAIPADHPLARCDGQADLFSEGRWK
ncbi:hypothetical protein ACU635_43735 [[Actinomadura] parvosata]|uniref:hypothetical protein n=1 Tax=[Actinomadura] parvosata TaxID=1955412 RepID=UPI00406C383C